MRLLGCEIRRLRPAHVFSSRSAMAGAKRASVPSPLGRLQAMAYGNADRRRELELYRELRRLMPILDAAIHRLTRLVGYVRIEATTSLVADIEEFLGHVPVNGLQRGLDSFLTNHVSQMLLYGFAAGEIVPASRSGGVRALLNLDSRYVRVLEDDPPLRLGLGYQPPGTTEPTRIPERLALYSAHAPEGDSPYGTSLLRSMPFVAHILLTMERATQQTWERMGAPSYQVTWEPPESFVDPDGAKTRAVMSDIESGFTEAMQGRHDTGLVSDFFAAGNVTAKVLGADGQQLEFKETYRALTEQLIARTGLPPFMLGLSWSSTERMSKQQADMLISDIKDFRRELEPVIEQIVDLWLVLRRKRGRFRVRWSEVSLQDLLSLAEAANQRAQARRVDVEALATMVDRGWIDDAYAREQLFPSAQYESMDEPMEVVPRPDEETGG